jgi:hypothetical protein
MIERYTKEDCWPGRRITDYLNTAARLAPDKLAVIRLPPRDHLAASSSARSAGARPAWLTVGVQPGDVVSFRPRRDFAPTKPPGALSSSPLRCCAARHLRKGGRRAAPGDVPPVQTRALPADLC